MKSNIKLNIAVLSALSVTQFAVAGLRRQGAPPAVTQAGQGYAVDLPPKTENLVINSAATVRLSNIQSGFASVEISGTCSHPGMVGLIQTKGEKIFPQEQSELYWSCKSGSFSKTFKFEDFLAPGYRSFQVIHGGVVSATFDLLIDTQHIAYLSPNDFFDHSTNRYFENHWYHKTHVFEVEYRGTQLEEKFFLELARDKECTQLLSRTALNRFLVNISELNPVVEDHTRFTLYNKLRNLRTGFVSCLPSLIFRISDSQSVKVHRFSDIKTFEPQYNKLSIFEPQSYLQNQDLAFNDLLNSSLKTKLPISPTARDLQIFESYNAHGNSFRAANWMQDLDFSGVGWDAAQDGTLITSQHVIFTSHYPRSGPIVFHNRQGRPIYRNITAIKHVLAYGVNGDVAIGKLDYPVDPNVDEVAIYPILDLSKIASRKDVDNSPVLTTDQQRRVFIHKYKGETPSDPRSFILKLSRDLPSIFNYSFVTGDSSNPGFFLIDGQLFLAMTLTGGGPGDGESYGDPFVFERVQKAIDSWSSSKQSGTHDPRDKID